MAFFQAAQAHYLYAHAVIKRFLQVLYLRAVAQAENQGVHAEAAFLPHRIIAGAGHLVLGVGDRADIGEGNLSLRRAGDQPAAGLEADFQLGEGGQIGGIVKNGAGVAGHRGKSRAHGIGPGAGAHIGEIRGGPGEGEKQGGEQGEQVRFIHSLRANIL